MSRHPTNSCEECENVAEDYINFIIDESVPKNINLDEIKTCTKHDELLQYVIDSVKKNGWHKSKAKLQENRTGDYMMYYRVRHELSVSEKSYVLLRGQRIVIPQSLQNRVIKLAHEGHQGLVRTKQLLREKSMVCKHRQIGC